MPGKSMKPKTLSERVRDSEQRKRDKGLRKASIWCHPDDRDQIRNYAAKLTKKRGLL